MNRRGLFRLFGYGAAAGLGVVAAEPAWADEPEPIVIDVDRVDTTALTVYINGKPFRIPVYS